MKKLNMDTFRIFKLRRILAKINAIAKEMVDLTDEELQGKTQEFKDRLANGETLDDLLPEAFAAMREADKRILGKFPYDVQVLGGIVMHQGHVAEMKTGEGKTLTATLPLYLNALSGESVFLITTNDYLARRDMEEMKPVYNFMGISVATTVSVDKKKKQDSDYKRWLYQHDIVYTTNNILGFDYLIENLADAADQKFLRPFSYALIDEIDEVLLDTAQTPLIISGAPRVQSNLYSLANEFILTLTEEEYRYIEEENKVWLTLKGIARAEQFFRVENLYDTKHHDLNRHINLALRANFQFEKDKAYVVANGEVSLLDLANGRVMDGMKMQGGQHQAVEAKEGVKITRETRAMATITYQNLFRMFKKLSGMTGTGKPSENELIDTYNMMVVSIPTNRPVIRRDLPDEIYTTLPQKLYASLQFLKKYYAKGQPVLLFTGTVEMSEIYSEMLLQEGIPHNVLNARNSVKEALIISEAGQKGAITVATAMAGRGTDIKLGEGVKELGGLVVICTERLMNKRQDLQAKGRSGRQGDPGVTKTFISLEDALLVKYGTKFVKDYYRKYGIDNDQLVAKPLSSSKFKNAVEQAQTSSEDSAVSARSSSLEFDSIMNLQRNIVYQERDLLLSQEGEFPYHVMEIIQEVIDDFINQEETRTESQLMRFILDNMTYEFNHFEAGFNVADKKEVQNLLLTIAKKELDYKLSLFKVPDHETQFYKLCFLRAIDGAWIENVDNLQQLKAVVSSRRYNQRHPQLEYQKEVKESFEKMQREIKHEAVKYLLLSRVEISKAGELVVHFA